MSKLKRNRKNKKARSDPLKGKDLSKDAQKNEGLRQSKVLPLMEKLKSTVPNDKSMALGAITLLCEDQKLRQLFLREKLVGVVMERCLTDSNDELVVESFGLLRNLGIEEGYSVVKNYWRSDIWTVIDAALQKIQKSYSYLSAEKKDERKEDKSKVQLLHDFTENILSLIVVIASGSDDLCRSVLSKIDPVLSFVVGLLNWLTDQPNASKKLFNSLLEFIYELSSESIEMIEKLNSGHNFSIERITASSSFRSQTSNRLGRAYCEGITFNLKEPSAQESERFELSKNLLDDIFATFSVVDLNEIKQQLMPKDNSNSPISASGTDKKEDTALEEANKYQTKSDLNGIEISLDLITTILEFLSSENEAEGAQSLPNELVGILIKNIYPYLKELLRFDVENEGILLVTEKVLVCFNNMCLLFLTCQAIPTEWYDNCLEIWSMLVTLSSHDSIRIQTLCLDVLWAISKSLGPEIEHQIDTNTTANLITKCTSVLEDISREEEVHKDDLVRLYSSLIGFIGVIAPHKMNDTDIKNFSSTLLSSIEIFSRKLPDESSVKMMIDCVNSVFEIFGDKDYSYDYEVFVQNDYISKLVTLEPLIKQMYKGIDKNKNRLLKLQGEEVWINLGRFIQYKKDERPEIYIQ